MHRKLLVLLPLILIACDDSPLVISPHPVAVPASFGAISDLLDWSHDSLASAAQALAAGDSAEAAALLLQAMARTPTIEAPHHTYDDPLPIADGLMSGVINLPPHLDAELPLDPDWNEDPFGDPNWRFQFHSFRWSLPLLRAWQITGDAAYLDRLLWLMDDYADDMLFSAGPLDMTWYDMAASLRTEHWLTVWQVLLQEDAMDMPRQLTFMHWFWIHGDRLTQVVEYHGDNNHGTFHNRALIVLASIIPQFQSSAGWLAVSHGRAEQQIMDIVSSEGVEVEQSPAYHFFMLDILTEMQELMESVGIGLGPAAVNRLQGMAPFAARILMPSGEQPMLSDTPRVLFLENFVGMHPELDYALSSGTQGRAPLTLFESYPETGYVICRSGWGETRAYAHETFTVFDSGPEGGWHGHQDALTFCLFGLGKALIVDAGFHTYSAGTWRSWFTSPAAHNVLVHADGEEGGRGIHPQRLFWSQGSNWAWQAALLELNPERSWIRHFVYLPPDEILILDRLSGSSERSMNLLFHFHPDARLDLDGSRIHLQRERAAMDLFPLGQPQLAILTGSESPRQGWYSSSYGELEASPVAVYALEHENDFVTLLHVHDGGDPLIDFHSLDSEPEGPRRFRIERLSGIEELELWMDSGQLQRYR